MKIPRISNLGYFGIQKGLNQTIANPPRPLPTGKDTVSFSSSIAYYLKKYNTLPDEIKKVLKPKDAIDMFKNLEEIQKGITKGETIGCGNSSKVYLNPWLKDYYSLITQDASKTTQVIYSKMGLGDAVWSDDSNLIQIIQKA